MGRPPRRWCRAYSSSAARLTWLSKQSAPPRRLEDIQMNKPVAGDRGESTEVVTVFRPSNLDRFSGQILDVDAHEAIPINLWEKYFGEVGGRFADTISQSSISAGKVPEVDVLPITPSNVWKKKRNLWPGSADPARRLEIMDLLGIHRQLIFPGDFGLLGTILLSRSDDLDFMAHIDGDRHGLALEVINAHNEWCVRTAAVSHRLRPVAILIADSPAALLAKARELIDRGVRSFWLPVAIPPGGVSPAHSDLDPLWALLSAHDCPVLAHIGADESFVRPKIWRDAAAFRGWKVGGEFPLDPYTLSTQHLATENFLCCMVMGGVFERHPRLRYGAIELAAHWIGPLSENLDYWYGHQANFLAHDGSAEILPMKPSAYIARNVRVSPFDTEPVGTYMARYPSVAACYCFATDFPHPEGGSTPMQKLSASLAESGEAALCDFFTNNAKWILPD